MKYCPNCGAPIEDGHKFCANCGQRLAASVVMPPEPVYTDDPRLKQDPVLNASPSFDAPSSKEEKVPELTLEPDLWGLGTPAAAQSAPKPPDTGTPELTLEPQLWGTGAAAGQSAPEPAEPADAVMPEPAQTAQAAASVQAPVYAAVMEDIHYDNPLRDEKEQAHELPNDYTMSKPPQQQNSEKAPNEDLMLAWSIILTALCSICGIVGLVKSVKARKAPWEQKLRLLNSAKTWLIIGTALHVLGYIAGNF